MKWNKPLIVGSLILGFILIVTCLPGLFTDKNPYSIKTLKYEIEKTDGETAVSHAPFEPSNKYEWGSDELGRDLKAFIIYGTRLTLKIALIVTVMLFALALPLGLLSGFGYSMPKTIIRQVNMLFSGLPPLLFAIIVLQLNIFTRLDKSLSTLAFSFILTLVGFGKLSESIQEQTKQVLRKPFIRSEYLLGKSRYMVTIENVLPHIMPELVVLFFMEIARVLTLQIQLGLFSIFIGNLKVLFSNDFGVASYWNVSFEPEWASLLGYATEAMRVSPWMVIYPTLAFFITVLGFNMFGEGLRMILQDEDSMFVPKFRRLTSVIFLRSYRHHLKRKHALVLIIPFIVIGGVYLSRQTVRAQKQYITRDELPDRLYIGMDQVADVTGLLSQKLADMHVSPLYDDYVQSYRVDPSFFVKEGLLKMDNDLWQLDKDYMLASYKDYDVSAQILDARLISLFNESSYDQFKNKAVWIDGGFYSSEALKVLSQKLYDAGAKALLVENHEWQTSLGYFVSDLPLIGLNKSLEGYESISLKTRVEVLSDKGMNVLIKIPGKDVNASQEVILISLPLNYSQKEEGLITLNKSLNLIDQLKETNNRTYVIAFFDGTFDKETHGIHEYSKRMMFDPFMHTMYFDIRSFNTGKETTFNRDMAPLSDYFGVSFFESLDKQDYDYQVVKEKRPDTTGDLLSHPDFMLHHKKGINTIIMDVGDETFFDIFTRVLEENN